METNRKLSISRKYSYVTLDNETIFMPISENEMTQAYAFSDDVGKDIAEGIINHLSLCDIIGTICDKYAVDKERVTQDVVEIIQYLTKAGVVSND